MGTEDTKVSQEAIAKDHYATSDAELAVKWAVEAATKGKTYPDGRPLLVAKDQSGKETDLAWARTTADNMTTNNENYKRGLEHEVLDSRTFADADTLYLQARKAYEMRAEIDAASKGNTAVQERFAQQERNRAAAAGKSTQLR